MSPAEQQVLDLVLQGCTNQEIALRLRRAARTVEVHRSHILHKLDAESTVNLVRKCLRLGLLQDSPRAVDPRKIRSFHNQISHRKMGIMEV
ncbi:MAG: LuxR C-terminal-related transcriptional regulator [Sedimentisphaerales bacterium]|nr:LuxR C-terminal-related transcriptional regulator [Sedimentisphaerales bacterium]HNY80270.1 LuxR C-terminal-related transcriptional regulator [Sedimentisphaerales bacterium]HOH66030.1 LuxR C-terminal-related transcriptional regulator [Sedimentisphaerales bacterium]HQA89769.1 LuxR C-terminal-related transcriptional regulator [Sedimentisphaerales bacterium]HQN35529.1 LuxR C-terminal-related transcriptional regulator [Sedimentisphaerales bacterium]